MLELYVTCNAERVEGVEALEGTVSEPAQGGRRSPSGARRGSEKTDASRGMCCWPGLVL